MFGKAFLLTVMRFHVVSLPHTNTTRTFSTCAYTQKVRNFSNMMSDLGHDVFLYAGAENEARCTEHTVCLTEAERLQLLADGETNNPNAQVAWTKWHELFSQRVATEARARSRPGDFLCLIGGEGQKELADALPNLLCVEFGIGYSNFFSRFKVWESYAWMHTCYGARTGGDAFRAVGDWYDDVIPGYLDLNEFPYSEEKDEYFLFVGRLISKKGCKIASDVCRYLGSKLVVAGAGNPPDDYGEYVGCVDPEERGRLMSRAKALFVPTVYVEPFGNVAIEAQACGTPVITTAWGAMTETVIDGKTGFHCRTFEEFVEAARKAETLDPRLMRQHVEANYSLPVVAVKYERYFKRLSRIFDGGWYAID